MKKIVLMSVFLAGVMLLMPLSVIDTQTKTQAITTPENAVETFAPQIPEQKTDTFRVYNHETKKITVMNSEDYIFGVVAAEMPALYEPEALKAQAVAAYTYACFNRNLNKNEKYDVSTDYNVSQSYISEEKALKNWGSKAEEYKTKIKKAISDTSGYTIKYQGEIILSVYHAISSGKTEDSANVWGKSYPYLKSVDSSFDKKAENYCTEVKLTTSELKEKMKDMIDKDISPKDYFGDCSLSKTGLVKKIEFCNKNYTGAKIREILNLRSSNFTVDFSDGEFIFEVYGYGHGVGMSQYGANSLAKDGKNFKEILMHYYNGCSLSKE